MKWLIDIILEYIKAYFSENACPAKDLEPKKEPVELGEMPVMTPKSNYVKLFKTAKITRSKGWVKAYAKKMYKDKGRYKGVADHIGCPWWVVAMIHTMECSRSWKKGLHNGQPWNKRTTWVPKGRGPFVSWDEAAVDALKYDKAHLVPKWTLDSALYFLEGYNGRGYKKRKMNSPYLWAFTNHWTKGKYVSDGVFDPEADTKQAGICTYLLAMIELGYELEGITGQFDYGDVPKPKEPEHPLSNHQLRAAIWEIAQGEIGVKEIRGRRHNSRILEYHKTTGAFSTDEIAWCSSFVNWVCKEIDIKGTGKATARSWMKWGKATTKPQRGDVVVFWRGKKTGWQGHVALYSHRVGNKIYVLGGNQSNAVNVSSYNKDRLLGYRTLA